MGTGLTSPRGQEVYMLNSIDNVESSVQEEKQRARGQTALALRDLY